MQRRVDGIAAPRLLTDIINVKRVDQSRPHIVGADGVDHLRGGRADNMISDDRMVDSHVRDAKRARLKRFVMVDQRDCHYGRHCPFKETQVFTPCADYAWDDSARGQLTEIHGSARCIAR